ncbi:hypothetical protein DNU06_11165 [Putridiphycobacter roseus]|uniref:HTTM-like domain-containing protein n=1 Tax=Putridiphycobacter roseus TaxID=2219161 RepID=A0A2W1MXD5_9FLAO|nr:hypothetical protein [Putridiphycobacter roseus]PZE16809.1 hypothetical protein DNU06_11165 [Putridiphycobacter roseus]
MMTKIPYWFIKPFTHGYKIHVFKKVLYAFLILNTLTMFPMVDTIFSYNGIAGSNGFRWNGIESFLNILSHPVCNNRPYIAWFFVIGQLTALTFGWFKIWPKITGIAIYFFTTNLITKGGLFFTGGEVLLSILLFYLMFIHENKKEEVLQNILNNTFYYLILIQIIVLYFFSTFFKLFDPNWTNGMALVYVSEIPFYSNQIFYSFAHLSIPLSKMFTYAVLIYQGLFPIFVWIPKIKIPFLIFGVLLHLGIAFGMGIFTFGITMVISYILFLNEKQIRFLTQKFKRSTNG